MCEPMYHKDIRQHKQYDRHKHLIKLNKQAGSLVLCSEDWDEGLMMRGWERACDGCTGQGDERGSQDGAQTHRVACVVVLAPASSVIVGRVALG